MPRAYGIRAERKLGSLICNLLCWWRETLGERITRQLAGHRPIIILDFTDIISERAARPIALNPNSVVLLRVCVKRYRICHVAHQQRQIFIRWRYLSQLLEVFHLILWG